jgi:hypothetical protein
MNWMSVVPIIVVVLFWLILFVTCFVAFTRMLRLPTEPEIEAALEHANAEDGTQIHSH